MGGTPIKSSVKYSILRFITRKTVPFNYPVPKSVADGASAKFIVCGEDDKDDEDLLKEIFIDADECFELLFVNNGRKLIETLALLPADALPCLLVLDYNMPGLNGAEILRELKEDARYDKIPKIIWSTSGAEMYKQICLNLGAVDYVIKPSNVKDLLDIVRYMISYC